MFSRFRVRREDFEPENDDSLNPRQLFLACLCYSNVPATNGEELAGLRSHDRRRFYIRPPTDIQHRHRSN